MNEVFQDIHKKFETTKDALRVTLRVIEKSFVGPITSKHIFHGNSTADSKSKLALAIVKFEQLTIFELIAAFERILRSEVDRRFSDKLDLSDPEIIPIHETLKQNIEYWSFGGQLVDVFTQVTPTQRGEVKQLIQFRDWLAHGKFVNLPPPTTPNVGRVLKTLNEFLIAAQIP